MVKINSTSNYYSTSRVMLKYFGGEPLNVHDRINFRTLYLDPCHANEALREYDTDHGFTKN